MIFVVEGIDKVGKTILCNKLSEKTGIPVFKEDVNFKYWIERFDKGLVRELLVEKMLSILRVLKLTDSSMIFDRFHLSEYVYGFIERLAGFDYKIKEIDYILLEMDARIIVMHPLDIERSSEEHGKDLSEYEQRFRKAELKFTNCNVTPCTYLEIEQITDMFTNLYFNSMLDKAIR